MMRTTCPTILAILIAAVLQACSAREQLSGAKTRLLDRPQTYDLTFEGADSIPAGILQQVAAPDLEDFEAHGFRPAPIDDAAYAIEGHYHANGYPFAEVQYELERPEDGRPRVLFRVTEGTRYLVGGVSVSGQSAFAEAALARLLDGPRTRMFGLGELYFVRTQAQSARGAMENLYLESGFLDVNVSGPEVTFDHAERLANLAYVVVEGPRFRVLDVTLEPLPGHDLTDVHEGLEAFIGQAWYQRRVHEIRAGVLSALAERGFPDAEAEVAASVNSETGGVGVKVTLEPGPQVRISEVVIEGNQATRSRFIARQLGMAAGDLYSRSAERDAFSSLYATGLFNSVVIELEGSGNSRRLRVRVEEAQTRSISAEVGYGSFERARVMLSLSEANLFGTGRSLRLEAKLAERARGVRLVYTDPYTLDEGNVLGATLFTEERELVSFDSREMGTGVSLTSRYSEAFRNVYGYEYRLSESSNVAVSVPGIDNELQQDAYVSSLYLTNVYDTRNSFFLPREGTWYRLRTEVAPEILGSELHFVRLDGRVVRYHALDDRNFLAWTVRGGVIIPIGLTELIPLQERFFNGGQNTVRSFKEDELGPTDANGTKIGGEAYSVMSVEYRRDLIDALSAVLFADAGNVSLDHEDALEFADLRYGVGPGLRWLLPVGPVRLDWGINPNPRAEEADWTIQFTLGVAF
jgi:outer membrane protein insertion porin family